MADPSKTIQIGAFPMTRALRNVLRLVLLGMFAWIVYLAPPLKNWPMWLSAAGWIGFPVYWGIASKNSSRGEKLGKRPPRGARMSCL